MGATNAVGHPVRVSVAVLEGLDTVVLSGETDMNDTLEVQALAYLWAIRRRLGGSSISPTSM